MIGIRTRLRINAIVEGVPLMNEIEEFSPPPINTKKQTISGQFVDSDMVVGVEKLEWSIKFKGSQALILRALGKGFTDSAHINVTEAGKTQDGVPYFVSHDIHGPVTSINEEPLKQGEIPITTITGTAFSYKKIDSGFTVVDIDARIGRVDLGQGDIMDIFGALNR